MEPHNGRIYNKKCVLLAGQRIKPDVTHCEYFQEVYVQDVELIGAIKVIVGFLNAGMCFVKDVFKL